VPWRKAATILWIIVVLVCATLTIQRFAHDNPLETDLLTLLPATERNQNAEIALRELTAKLGNRVFFLVGSKAPDIAGQAADKFATSLRSSGAFRQVIDSLPPVDAQMVRDLYGPVANGLLSASDRATLSAKDFSADASLQKRLFQPFVTGIPTEPAQDPFGLLQHWLSSLPSRQLVLNVVDNRLVASDGQITYVVVIAEPLGSAFESNSQHAVVSAVDLAEAAARDHTPRLVLLRTGAVFYGERARTQAEAEVDMIGGGSLIGIILMLWAMFRSARQLVFGLTTVLTGITCGMAAVLLADGRIHLITLVFGASLIGEAVDYSIQYFATHLDAGRRWEPIKGLQKILPGLAVALVTSLIGYAALSLTPFPAISQIALFAFVGLSAAWLSVALLLPWGMKTPSDRDPERLVRWPRRILAFWREQATPGFVLGLAAAITVLSVPGIMRITPEDNVRTLVTRPADLVSQESEIRRLVGMSGSGRFFMTEGESHEQLLQREEALTQRLRSYIGEGITGYAAVSSFVPSALSQHENQSLVGQQLSMDTSRPLLTQYGFPDKAAAQWSAILDNERYLTLEDWLASPLSAPFRHLTVALPEGRTALLLTMEGDDGRVDFTTLAADLPGVTFVNKAGSVSAIFAQYRQLTSWWIPLACLVILVILALRYGWRNGLAILLPTLLGLAVAVAAHGYADQHVTLFSAMGLMLVLGVGVNYAIFIVEADDGAPAPFAGVLLSAATTILSFGLLTLSSMPALHQFGFSLLFGIFAAVALAPLSLVLVRSEAS
jgi:predicted exporter